MRAAVYARVSSEEQAERGTIENQIEFATKYCDLHQIDIVEWYKDDGITGIIPLEERPEGKRLLEDAQNKKFDLVLVYRLDRLGRSARIILNAVHELEQYGVKIKSMTEPFDTGDANGRFLLTVLAGVADLERETILERMQHGANRAARAGKWLGGIVPYGYRVNEEGYLEINEDLLPGLDMSEADVVRLIYYLIAEQGYSTIKVADYLNALGVPTAYVKDGRQVTRGKRKVNTSGIWRPGRIRNMVVNTTYKGIHYYGKRTTKNRELIPREVPAIVSEEVWEKAQQKLRENQIEAMKNAKRQYLLRGLIKCSLCGLTYQGQSYKGPGGKLKAYYVCGGKTAYRGPFQGKCPSKNVPAEWIENHVWEECVRFIENPGETINELANTIETKKTQRKELEHEKQIILETLKEKELERQNILDLYRKKIITADDIEKQFQKIKDEMVALEKRVKEIEKQIVSEETLLSSFNTAEELLANLRAKLKNNPPFEVRREIVRTLVKEIIVDTKFDEKNRPYAIIKVKYNFSDVTRTVNRAGNNFDFTIERQIHLPAYLPGNVLYNDELQHDDNFPGVRIRLARITKSMTIEDLAKASGITKFEIGKIERDERKPSIATLRKFSQVLKVPIAYLGCFEQLPEDTLGQRIIKARLFHGFTQREFAKILGVNHKILHSWEQDKTRPSPIYFNTLEQFLKVLEEQNFDCQTIKNK